MERTYLFFTVLLFAFVCIFGDEIHVKPGTYDSIPAKPGDSVIFYPGEYVLAVNFKLVPNVAYWGNSSVIKNSQTWNGASGVKIYGFTFNGTTLSWQNNDTDIHIARNIFYSVVNSPSSAIIDMFSTNQVVIENNTIYGINDKQLGLAIAQSTDIVIANNTLYSSSIEFQIYSTENDVNVYKTEVRVTGNCFFNVSGGAILIFLGIDGPDFLVTLSNNTIYNYHSKLPDFTRAINLQLQDQPFVVEGNYLSPAEASGTLCNFCTPIVIQTSAVQKNSTISNNIIGGNAWSYYVQCFAQGDFTVPVVNNWFFGNVTPPVSAPCGTRPNTIRPRDEVPAPTKCWK